MSDNWVVQNLENALETWNEKLSEIWTLITTTPQNFKGGNIWKVIVDINYRACLACIVFRDRYGKDLRKFYRCEETGTRTETLCSFCTGERCYHIRNGAYACII